MTYPFTAVVGQDEARLALLLCAVNPRIGGVILSGEKGTAKSTVVRGLVELLPGHIMRTLALGTTEDRLCLLYTSPSPRDLSTSRMPSSA